MFLNPELCRVVSITVHSRKIYGRWLDSRDIHNGMNRECVYPLHNDHSYIWRDLVSFFFNMKVWEKNYGYNEYIVSDCSFLPSFCPFEIWLEQIFIAVRSCYILVNNSDINVFLYKLYRLWGILLYSISCCPYL